jgi:imidazolonepropionase-like amidohydrolase
MQASQSCQQAAGAVARDHRARKIADLTLLDGDPLDDIGNVGSIRAVIRAGQQLKRPTSSDAREEEERQ